MRISDWSSDVCSSDLQLGEAHRDDRAHLDRAAGRLFDHAQRLHLGAAERDDHAPGGLELFEQFRRRLGRGGGDQHRSEEHTSELQSLMRISYAVFCLKKNNITTIIKNY